MTVLLLILAAAVSVQASTARLQIIHNSADPAAETVDIYVNAELFIDDCAFRDATAFQTVPAGIQLDIGVAPASSGSSDDVIATIPVTLQAHKTYVAIADALRAFIGRMDSRLGRLMCDLRTRSHEKGQDISSDGIRYPIIAQSITVDV